MFAISDGLADWLVVNESIVLEGRLVLDWEESGKRGKGSHWPFENSSPIWGSGLILGLFLARDVQQLKCLFTDFLKNFKRHIMNLPAYCWRLTTNPQSLAFIMPN